MAFNALTTTEIQAGKPTKQSIWQKVKDNFDFFNSSISGGSGSPVNGSFEIDADSDGIPDNWTRALFSGGTFELDTTTPAHGTTAVKFTDPGGSGNGGGYIESDYMEVNDTLYYSVSFMLNCSNADVGVSCVVRCFDVDKVDLSADVTAYTATSAATGNPTSWERKIRGFTASDSDTRFIKIRLNGGTTAYTAAASRDVYFDDVIFKESNSAHLAPFTSGPITLASTPDRTQHNETAAITFFRYYVPSSGTLKMYIEIGKNGNDETITFKKNGSSIGTQLISGGISAQSRDVAVEKGDYLEITCNGASTSIDYQNVGIYQAITDPSAGGFHHDYIPAI